MEQCWLLGEEALKLLETFGSEEGLACLWRGCIAVLLYLLKVVVLSPKSKSIFQEFNEPTTSMEGVQAGLQLFPAGVERKEKSVSADCSWLQLLLNYWSFFRKLDLSLEVLGVYNFHLSGAFQPFSFASCCVECREMWRRGGRIANNEGLMFSVLCSSECHH